MNHQPTDMMRRRASLPLRERFFWSRTPITICTNSNAVLNAAEQAGLIAHHGLEREHGLRWEIVVEREHIAADENWECKATLDAHSIYLTVGSYQWFAFDLETGEGAGFAVIPDLEQEESFSIDLYLQAIIDNIAAILRDGTGENA